MRHLYLKIYLAFLGMLLAGLAGTYIVAHTATAEQEHEREEIARGVADVLVASLPEVSTPQFEPALREQAKRLGVELLLWNADHQLVGSSIQDPPEFPKLRHGNFFRTSSGGGWLVQMSNGYWLGALFQGARPHRGFLGVLLVFGLFSGIAAYPLARGITRRVERLQATVDAFGHGNLSLRAAVLGKDEIAKLAASFNTTAQRIEDLVSQQKRILASASHELRSPLTRLRMVVELMSEGSAERRQQLAQQAEQDVRELDDLIEDLLLAARTDSTSKPNRTNVDFGALVKCEAERQQVACQIDAVHINAEARLLRRLVRNLLDNALQHGDDATAKVSLQVLEDSARLCVEDAGAGVPETERERIFEPFYRPSDHSESEHGGVGLGLALVRQIAEHHGGNAWYEPRPTGGSRFIVQLPLNGIEGA